MFISPTTMPYVMWLGALAAVCGLVVLKSASDAKTTTTGAEPARGRHWPPPRCHQRCPIRLTPGFTPFLPSPLPCAAPVYASCSGIQKVPAQLPAGVHRNDDGGLDAGPRACGVAVRPVCPPHGHRPRPPPSHSLFVIPQGPYVYALYEFYKFNMAQIGQLFIVGFGSSMVFGTFIGGLADRYGRKLNCIVFTVLYSLSCLTKHSPSFEVLLVGRLLGGVATSILMSAFETWMIHEHKTVSGHTRLWCCGARLPLHAPAHESSTLHPCCRRATPRSGCPRPFPS